LDKQAIGNRIRELRESAGLSQGELADRARRYAPGGKLVTRNSISRYENGHTYPDSWMATAIAKALEVSAEYVLGQTDDPTLGSMPPFPIPKPDLYSAVAALNELPADLRRRAIVILEEAIALAQGWSTSSYRLERLAREVETEPALDESEGLPADVRLAESLVTNSQHSAGDWSLLLDDEVTAPNGDDEQREAGQRNER
jgi:transcriptional regulator with XRE-family HTH domain